MPDTYKKTIICLANSRKLGGRCVAGIDVDDHRWVRPVSATANGELSPHDRQFEDGSEPRILDVVRVRLRSPKAHAFQSENHVIDDRHYWTFLRRASWREARALADDAGDAIWVDGSSTFSGQNDRVPLDAALTLDSSLMLVEVSDLAVRVSAEGAKFDNHALKVRGIFTFGAGRYGLLVTDPDVEAEFKARGSGEYDVGRALLCLSLGEPHDDGYVYKMIAGMLTP